MKILKSIVPLLAVLLVGCQSYSWRPTVPEEMRSVSVPVFRNGTRITELGAKVTTQVLREFQREGTFRLATPEDCAIEIQGELQDDSRQIIGIERVTGTRSNEFRLTVTALVSFIDKRSGKVVVSERRYGAETTFLVNDDLLTGERDASGRLAEDLARQIVDDALMIKW